MSTVIFHWNSPLLMICPRDPLVSLMPRTTGHEPIVLDQTWSNHLVGDIRCTKRIRSTYIYSHPQKDRTTTYHDVNWSLLFDLCLPGVYLYLVETAAPSPKRTWLDLHRATLAGCPQGIESRRRPWRSAKTSAFAGASRGSAARNA